MDNVTEKDKSSQVKGADEYKQEENRKGRFWGWCDFFFLFPFHIHKKKMEPVEATALVIVQFFTGNWYRHKNNADKSTKRPILKGFIDSHRYHLVIYNRTDL